MAERINEFETVNNQQHKVNQRDNNMYKYNNIIKSPGLEITNNDKSLFPLGCLLHIMSNAIQFRIENKEKKSNK